jgi:RHS repeat-associated protein
MDLNLNLYYNSRVWDVDTIGHSATFNADRDFPSYGFRLDFGYLEYDTGSDQFILTESDGTKRALPDSNGFTSTDGSYVTLNFSTKVATYKNGTTAQYAVFPSNGNLFRPTQIKDTNGNYITITYLSGTNRDQMIQSITDTLGRVVNFHYDASDQLSYIDQNVAVSTLDPTGVHRYVTFTWGSPYAVNYHWHNFTGLTVKGAPDFSTQLHALTGCTYANGTGYSFTYGDWGIINEIANLSALGATRSYVSYNYPLASAGPQSDAPTYNQQTVSPDNTNTSIWNYSATKAGVGIVTAMTVTDPATDTAAKSITVTSLDQSTGLPASVQVKNNAGTLLRTTAYSWTSSGGAMVPSSITTTLNDTGQQSSIQYSNYDAYGDAGDIYENDFGGTLLRHTVTTFYTTPFTTHHILGLPQQVLIKDAAGNIISRTGFNYDTTSITNITDAPQHDNSLSVHGNLTLTQRYSNAAAGTGEIDRHVYFDSTGNVRTAELDCCNQKVFNYSLAYQYAYPESMVRGPSGLQFTTSYAYNKDFGWLTSVTDENNQVIQYQYDSMGRSTGVTLPPQGSTSVQYTAGFDDTAALPTITKSATPSTVTVPTTVTTLDGLGHILRVDTKNGTTLVSSITTSYDELWRSKQVSNPFAPGDSQVFASFSYDPLGRTKQVTPPSGGYMQYSYSGNTATVADPAGKLRKSYTDALGRLVQVDEPGVVGDHLPANNFVTMQSDSNFVLYDPFNNLLWSTGTAGIPNAQTVIMQDDGNLVLYIFKWQAGVYAAPSPGPFPPQSCGTVSYLAAGQRINANQCLVSPHGQYILYMAADGNFYIYDIAHSIAPWGAGTYGHPGAYATMQTDGNFVVYDANNVALWNSGTAGSGAERLDLEDDGRIIIWKSAWNSGTSTGQFNWTQLAHPSCDMGTGIGTTGVLGTGQCLVSPNGHYEMVLQTDGNMVIYDLGVTPANPLWSTNTALTPLSLDVAFHTTYSYDPLGNLSGVSQGNITGQSGSGQTRSYVYDGLGRMTSSTTPESGTVASYYTALSGGSCGASDPNFVCRIQDARGEVKNLTYDAFNRMTAVQYTNTSGGADPFNTPPVTYQYDAGGAAAFALTRLTKIIEGPATPSPVNSHMFTYDNLGRVITDAQSIDQQTYTTQYAYNLASEITSVTYPSNHVAVQTYDAIGRLCSIGVSGSTCTSGTRYMSGLTFNSAGEVLGLTMGNGVQGAFTYNDHLQLASLRYFKTGVSPDMLNVTYDYTSAVQQNNNEQIQVMHYYVQPGTEDQTKSVSFSYDQLGRLSSAQTLTVNATPGSKTWSLQWTYDRFGNRLTQQMSAGDPTLPVNQPILNVNSATNYITNAGYTYDVAGNMTHDANAAYTYDGANRLTKINSTAAVYTYFGPQRIKKVVGSGTTRYIYSGNKVIAEYSGTTPTLSVEYVYAGSQLLATIAGTATTYHLPDHLSNRAESDSSGTVTRTFGHFPFGDIWYETTSTDKWKFTSYEHDSGSGETGLDYADFRYYASGTARFMSPDLLPGHLLAPQSLNRYAYVVNDPVRLTDPQGLDCIIDGKLDGSIPTSIECEARGGYWDFSQAAVGTDVFACPFGAVCSDAGPGDLSGGGLPWLIGGSPDWLNNMLDKLRAQVCKMVPDVTTAGVGGDLALFFGQGLQIGVAANGNSGELGLTITHNFSGGLTSPDAYVYGGIVWNAPNNSTLGGQWQHPMTQFTNSWSASVLKNGVNVDENGNITGTFGPSLFPIQASMNVSRTGVPVNIPYAGYLLNPNRAFCKFTSE